MEVYILDSLLRRVEVIDRFESLIWTERWSGLGDFEMIIRSTFQSRTLLQTDTMLAHSHSLYIMKIETVENDTSEDGLKTLKVKGRSLEKLLEDRVARPSTANLSVTPTWDLVGPPATLMRQIFHDICVTGILSEFDVIPFIVEARHPSLPADNIAEPLDPIALKLDPMSVYNALSNIGNTWLLGFRMLRNYDQSQLYFDVYAGVDRTSGQSTYAPVIFTPELDNLQNTTELKTVEDFKNVAYVFSPVGFLEVTSAGVDPEVEGFERRVLIVQADDITSGTSEEITSALTQRGAEALSEHRAFQAFDGEISQSSQYIYGMHYYLGDLVELRNEDGVTNKMRVTEQIFVSDKEGERMYPTLALNIFINTGSWLSWESNKRWIDYDTDYDTVWETLP